MDATGGHDRATTTGTPRHRRAGRRWRTVIVMTAAGAMVVPTGATAGGHTDWSAAVEVPNVNAPGIADGCPIESPDGQQLFIASRRGPGGDNDIWVATRGADGEFGAPTMLPAPVNSDADDFCPTPMRGNHLLFVSTRGGVDAYGTRACGGGDIYLTRRSPATDSWQEPRNLGLSLIHI